MPARQTLHPELDSKADAPEGHVVEVPVLLESSLLCALEVSANEQGMTAGALVRRLVRELLSSSRPDEPAS